MILLILKVLPSSLIFLHPKIIADNSDMSPPQNITVISDIYAAQNMAVVSKYRRYDCFLCPKISSLSLIFCLPKHCINSVILHSKIIVVNSDFFFSTPKNIAVLSAILAPKHLAVISDILAS